MSSLLRGGAFSAILLAGLPALACDAACDGHGGAACLIRAAADPAHIVVASDDLAWSAGPASLPAGAEIALIEGNPGEAGPFTFRLRFPAGYRIPPHTHPAIEHVTVLSGTFGIGMGESFDPESGRELTEGGFVALPPGHAHFAWAREATVVQLHSIGPWGITYLDPADDPRGH